MLWCSDQAFLGYRYRVGPKRVIPSVTVEPLNGDFDAYGKNVSELQEGVEIGEFSGGGSISGTLNYVTGYTGFNSAEPDEQEGYYLALKFTPPSWDGILTVELVGGTKGPVTLTQEDNFCVFKIDDVYRRQTIKVEYVDDDLDYERNYLLDSLYLPSMTD